MSEVIFCKTRYQDIGYHSYSDFWRLVELAGYPVIYVDELDAQSDNIYILTPLNDEWLAGWQSPRARIIHYELEWRTDWRAEVNEPPGVAEVWVCDKHYAEHIGAKYVPMGSDERLNEARSYRHDWNNETNYDVALMAYRDPPRRQIIIQELRDRQLSIAPNAWKIERSSYLMSSRTMVHIHQTEQSNGIAPLRWCLAAAHRLPIISETVPDRGIFGYTHMMTADYHYLAGFVKQALGDHYLLSDYASALHSLLCHEWTFRRCIEANV